VPARPGLERREAKVFEAARRLTLAHRLRFGFEKLLFYLCHEPLVARHAEDVIDLVLLAPAQASRAKPESALSRMRAKGQRALT